MGGRDGSGSLPGGGWPPEELDCSAIRDTTILNSPDPVVLSRLSVGDVLSIRAESDDGPLVAVDSEGSVAGSITSLSMSRMLRCISEGWDFQARVSELEGGRCRVEIWSVGS